MAGGEKQGRAGRLWTKIYGGLWLALLLLAVAGIAAGNLDERHRVTESRALIALGLRTGVQGGETILRAPYDRAGDLARQRPGDRIVSVDGRPAPRAYADFRELCRQVGEAPGPVVRVGVLGQDGTRRDLALLRSGAHAARAFAGSGLDTERLDLFHQVLGLANQLALVGASVLLFLRARCDPVAGVIALSFLLLAAATVYGPVAYYQHMPGLEPYALARPVIGALGWLGLMGGLLVFPSGRFDPPWTRWVMAGCGAYFIANLLTAFGRIDGMAMATLNTVIYLLVVAAQIVRYRRLPPGVARQQIRWVLFAMAAAVAPGVALPIVDIVRAQTADFRVVAWLFLAVPALFLAITLLFTGGLSISLLKYRLYDAEAVISRSAGYAILTLGLAATWAGAEKALEVSFEAVMGHEAGAATAGVAAGLAALLVTPAHHRVMHWTERVFQRGLSDLRRALPAQLADLRDTASLGELAEAALAHVEPALRAASAAVVVRGGPAWRIAGRRDVEAAVVQAWIRAHRDALRGEATAHDRADPQFPLRLALEMRPGAAPTGWLLLGPRPDGSFYGREELEALAEIARPLARALQVAQAREAREAALRRELDRLRADLAELRRGLRPAAE